jgi:hypothetical protein
MLVIVLFHEYLICKIVNPSIGWGIETSVEVKYKKFWKEGNSNDICLMW